MDGIKNGEIWLKLTALVIHAAVSGINRYNGKYYFSVNIPPQLAAGNALPGMAKKAVEMLLKPQWAGKLVFELAETIDVTQRLRAEGCRLFLDDCFSMLPIRQINVDGLKLDRDIVEHFVANDNDNSIIKAIQIYSDMTGRECVAEGVDSEEKFEKLVALGVKRFQGYYLSRAVKEDELDRMVRLFS
ncbi:EAL domain-containing protein [Enterobacter hormaechei]|nr:EAL domain-containing protein [Enterobacter hormaechei]